MTWTAKTFTFGQILSETDMLELQDNFEAVAENHSGAPQFEASSFKSILDSTYFSSSTASSTGSIAATTTLDFTLAEYCTFPWLGGDGPLAVVCNDAAGVDGEARIGLTNLLGSSYNYNIAYRYFD